MRSLLVLSVALFCFAAKGQNIYTSKKDIADAKEIIFYGYDFSHFKLADEDRILSTPKNDPAGVKEQTGNGIKVYVSAWVGYLLDKMSEKYFARKLKTDKVTNDLEYTLQIIRQLNDSNIVSSKRSTIPRDSIQAIVSRYQVKQNEGIGFTIIVECFNKEFESSSAYFTFFDIATKKVLMSDHFRTSHASGIGLTKHWGFGFYYTVDSYISNEFKSNVKKSR